MNRSKILTTIALSAFLALAAGCNFKSPRPRMGTLPTPPPGPRFAGPNDLGSHSYFFDPFEKNTIVYTCKAGHIDLTHVRWNADYVRYLIGMTRETLLNNQEGFAFNVTWEPSTHYISFDYPDNWQDLSDQHRKTIADEVAFDVAPYIALNATTWHEIVTWFGTRFALIEPEFNSAFSWEDMFSNLVGVRLGLQAMRSEKDYDQAMTTAINEELEKLGVQSKKTAIHASSKMRGKWYSGRFHVDTKMRNFDIGLDDGQITPTLVPDIESCPNPEPVSYPVPKLEVIPKHGFTMQHKIEPNIWEAGKIYDALEQKLGLTDDPEYIIPEEHYRAIVEFSRKQAVEKYNYLVQQ